ncbi:MAG: Uma2 family endonuclease [Streptomyces sp.]|uniref:Uma2 family endonuclease n=1 Tax=Streptomyces sp. TaxID=1931 RepID=UPI003D6A59A0
MVTIELTDRIETAVSGELSLDDLFERLERMPVPEGYKTEIVEGTVTMSPQRDTHWEIILEIVEQLRTRYARNRIKSDVRFDFPGHLNGFAPDVVALGENAQKDAQGRWQHEDVECVAEVLSEGTARNDYGKKKQVYALAEIPVFLIADPYAGECHLYTNPKDGGYKSELTVAFGESIDLTGTVVGLHLETKDFPRD